MTLKPDTFAGFDPARVPSPCHVIDVAVLEANLAILAALGDRSGAKILLALKAFSCLAVADLVMKTLAGTAASGLHEARLGRERFGGEVHAYVPGLKRFELDELCRVSDHLIFNSLGQHARFAGDLPKTGRPELGLRINPRHSEVTTPLYDPCAAWSRLGVPIDQISADDLEPFDGLHVHALCDQDFAPFDRLLTAVEEKAGHLFGKVDWLNLGGGQLLTAPDYPLDRLAERLTSLRRRTGLAIYLEPGTAVALDAGVLVGEVLDCGWNDGRFAVTDVSATCHMPDVIEAPYMPDVAGARTLDPGGADPADPLTIRLTGPTCLAGDVIGTYRFESPLREGDRFMIRDQAYYTMVKATTFNGTPLPALALWDSRTDDLQVVRRFGYEDFVSRLA